MWENPYYYFRIHRMNKFGNEVIEEIKIDVTNSAWAKEISKDCKNVLDIILESESGYNIKKILDFGCGKFTSTNYILMKNLELTVVEFKELIQKHEYLEPKLEIMKRHSHFSKMDFPNPFINDSERYDLCLLIHVLPVMPIFLERLQLISILHDKIRDNKYLLWYAMKNPSIYRKRENTNSYYLGDGIWIGPKNSTGNPKNTFYKYHEPAYLIYIMFLSGFDYERTFKVPSTDAILFKKGKYNLLDSYLQDINVSEIINYQMIKNHNDITPKNPIIDDEEINPYPIEFNLYNISKSILSNIRPGRVAPNPNLFKRIIAGIMQFVFSNQLSNMTIEDPMNMRSDIVDITFQNVSKEGFFFNLRNTHSIKCPIIFIEVKNKTDDLSNEEFQQLYDRFDPIRGEFGILVCRKIYNQDEIMKQIIKRLRKGYSIVFEDSDISKLLKFRIENGFDDVNNYIEQKFKDILMMV